MMDLRRVVVHNAEMSVTSRRARASDYPTFARLFIELGVDDPVPSADVWEQSILPTTLVAERGGQVVGYAYYQRLRGVGYLRNIAVAPDARRRGAGRALLEAVAAELHRRGSRTWCLNVKPDNLAAIRLYEQYGLRPAYEATQFRFPWTLMDVFAADKRSVVARPIEPEDERGLEAAFSIVPGLLEDARLRGGCVLLQLCGGVGVPLGAAVFSPTFPGAFPFRVADPALAAPLLRALRAHALDRFDYVLLVVEDDAALAERLRAVGAPPRLHWLHYRGAVPPA